MAAAIRHRVACVNTGAAACPAYGLISHVGPPAEYSAKALMQRPAEVEDRGPAVARGFAGVGSGLRVAVLDHVVPQPPRRNAMRRSASRVAINAASENRLPVRAWRSNIVARTRRATSRYESLVG